MRELSERVSMQATYGVERNTLHTSKFSLSSAGQVSFGAGWVLVQVVGLLLERELVRVVTVLTTTGGVLGM